MKRLSVDLETYSSVDLKKSGAFKYARSPDFEILLFAYAWDDQPVQIVDLAQGDTLPADLVGALFDEETIISAYNASFEWICLNRHFRRQLDIRKFRCTMAHGLYCGYTAGLGATGEAMGIPQDRRKMGVGGGLIRTFCIPCKPTKTNGQRTRTYPRHEPEKWETFKAYCIRDVETEREIARRLAVWPMPEREQRLWELDVLMNNCGVRADRQMIEGALHCDEIVTRELLDEAVQISGLANPKSVSQLTKWLEEEIEEDIPNLQKQTVTELLGTVESPEARRMLEIRQELGKASVAKYRAMANAICDDDRIRGISQYYGANRTGRYAGRLVQMQNLTRNYIDTLDFARDWTAKGDLPVLKMCYGNVPDVLSQLIRTAFIPSPGKMLAVADFSAIEARIIAWLAGEQWRLDVFASHGKIYEASASAMFGVRLEDVTKELRQRGKVAELALGYNGGPGALVKMGALKQGLTEEELPDIVSRWRAASPNIVRLWKDLEQAAISAVTTGRPSVSHGLVFAREYDEGTGQDFMTIRLPVGRKLFYAKPHIALNRFDKPALHFFGVNQISKKWSVDSTYGGRETENVVQAIARDCLTEILLMADQAGMQTIFHVHDELVIDTPNPGDLDTLLGFMAQPIPWAKGLILKGAGFTSSYYMKD